MRLLSLPTLLTRSSPWSTGPPMPMLLFPGRTRVPRPTTSSSGASTIQVKATVPSRRSTTTSSPVLWAGTPCPSLMTHTRTTSVTNMVLRSATPLLPGVTTFSPTRTGRVEMLTSPTTDRTVERISISIMFTTPNPPPQRMLWRRLRSTSTPPSPSCSIHPTWFMISTTGMFLPLYE